MQQLLIDLWDILACPACGGRLEADARIECSDCGRIFAVDSEIPLLFHPQQPGSSDADVTDIVKSFYEENPFPNYDDMDSRESLEQKASAGIFGKLLNDQLPRGITVLEAGCGTGQLSNFLGMAWGRRVIGTDLCLNSLRLAAGFRDRFEIANAGFLQMNLFRPAFRPESFDVIISNGVLHHTSDPLGGFQSLAKLLKPGGVFAVGLYNRIGRLTTDLRRWLFEITGDRLTFLDGHMRNRTYNQRRKTAWFMDQYKHPHESKHGYSEVIEDWLDANGFEFVSSIPKIGPAPFDPREKLFEPHDRGTHITRFLTEADMLVRGGVDGALFIIIGRKQCQTV
jgi:SAM-dependent methyltransferase